MQSQPAVSASYHGTDLSAQSNGERQCSPHLPHRQTRGWGLRHRHRRLPPCAILRDLEHSNRSAASIGMHHARKRPSSSDLPVNETNQMLARHARAASVRASHPSNHLTPAPTPGSSAICLLSHLPRFHSVPFVQHRTFSISFHPASTPPPPHSIHTTKSLSRHSTLCILITASPTRHPLRNRPLASALLLANFRPSSAPPTQRTHTSHNRSSSITKTKNPSPQQCLTNTTTACLTTLPSRRMRRTTLTATTVAAGGARELPRRMRTGSSRRNATSRRSHPSLPRTRSTYSVWRLRRASNLTTMSSSVPSTS